MRHTFVNADLLQRIRLEIASQHGGELDLDGLRDVSRDKLKTHLERLFYGGELDAEVRIETGGLELKPRRLSPYGVLAMHAGISKGHARRNA